MSFAVVIPSRNADNLEPCVRAIRAAGETCRIVVVDDGLARRPEGCEYVPGIRPFVFARAINSGVGAAPDADGWIWLNDDAVLETPQGFTALAEASAAHPEYGIISSTTNCSGNLRQLPKGIGLRQEHNTLAFVCVYVPRATVLNVGLLDERFTTYGWEDNDLCRRVKNAGLKLGIFDGCFVDHRHLPSTFRGQPGAAGDIEPGRRIYLAKWGSM